MKLSFATLATPELNGVEAIKLARRIGYDGVDLRVSENRGEVTLSSTPKELSEIKNALKAEEITLSSLLCYHETAAGEKESFHGAVDGIKRHIELADRLGAISIRIAPGKIERNADINTYFEKFSEVLLKAADEGTNGINVLVQNHYNSFSATACAKVIKTLNKPNVALFFSTEHCLIQGENFDEVLKEVQGITRQVFLADIIMKENDYEDVLSGLGEVPLEKIYQALGGKSFDGWVSFKWERLWRPELVGYEIALAHFIKYFETIDNH